MFTPFWGKHVDSEACSIEEEFENHGFSDFLLSLMANPLLIIVHIFNRFIATCIRIGQPNRPQQHYEYDIKSTPSFCFLQINFQLLHTSLHHTEDIESPFYMIEILFSSLPGGKDADLPEAGLSSIIVNIALVVGTIILKPAIERQLHPAIWGHTPTNLDKRQVFKSVLGRRRDVLSPAFDGLSTLHLEVKPTKPVIATAVTVVKAVPTPVQIFQEQSSFLAIMGIIACAIFALIGTVLAFQHHHQGASWSSLSASSSDNSESSLEPYGRDSTSPNDDSSSDEDSGSGGHPPPAPVFDLDFPTLQLDKAVDTGDEQVRDEDAPPPPPPPPSPTPVEEDDAFLRKPFISKWLSFTLALSIISLVIKRFFKRQIKTQDVSSTPGPTVSERITVNEISGDVVTLLPSATPNPVINVIDTNPTGLQPLIHSFYWGNIL